VRARRAARGAATAPAVACPSVYPVGLSRRATHAQCVCGCVVQGIVGVLYTRIPQSAVECVPYCSWPDRAVIRKRVLYAHCHWSSRRGSCGLPTRHPAGCRLVRSAYRYDRYRMGWCWFINSEQNSRKPQNKIVCKETTHTYHCLDCRQDPADYLRLWDTNTARSRTRYSTPAWGRGPRRCSTPLLLYHQTTAPRAALPPATTRSAARLGTAMIMR
jgi:hypothetical protein